jgi:hypothetical protein
MPKEQMLNVLLRGQTILNEKQTGQCKDSASFANLIGEPRVYNDKSFRRFPSQSHEMSKPGECASVLSLLFNTEAT